MASGGWRPRTLLAPTVHGPACATENHSPERTSPRWGTTFTPRTPLSCRQVQAWVPGARSGPATGRDQDFPPRAPELAAVAPPFRWDFLSDPPLFSCPRPPPHPRQPSPGSPPLAALPRQPSHGTVQAAGPEALGTFLTFALVSSSSWQLLTGPLSTPKPGSLRCPLFSLPLGLGLVPSLHPPCQGSTERQAPPREECGVPPAVLGLP